MPLSSSFVLWERARKRNIIFTFQLYTLLLSPLASMITCISLPSLISRHLFSFVPLGPQAGRWSNQHKNNQVLPQSQAPLPFGIEFCNSYFTFAPCVSWCNDNYKLSYWVTTRNLQHSVPCCNFVWPARLFARSESLPQISADKSDKMRVRKRERDRG